MEDPIQIGANATVDDISTDHLKKLRTHLGIVIDACSRALQRGATPAQVMPELLEAVMIRAAQHMHDAATDAYSAGEAVTAGVVPEAM